MRQKGSEGQGQKREQTGAPHDCSMAPDHHPLSFRLPYLTLGQALEAVMHNQDSVALDEANSHGGADGGIHACCRSPHIHHGHCVQARLWRSKQRGSRGKGGTGQKGS